MDDNTNTNTALATITPAPLARIATLKPGLLVSLRTSLQGGVEYQRVDLNTGSAGTDGVARVEEWQTTKVTQDPEEHEKATKIRGKAGSVIRAVCVPSAFGYVCPVEREADLDAAVAAAREMVDAFNATARTCRIGVYTLKGRIAQTDDEAVRAISGELRELLDEMAAGIAAGKVSDAREAASKAKKLGAMLSDETADKVNRAIEEVRETAREIVKKLADGEDAAIAVRDIKLQALDQARSAFLDLDVVPDTAGEALPSVTARAVDVDDEPAPELPAASSAPSDGGYEAMAASAPAAQRTLDV
jgi:hypothetical protein